MKVLVDDALKYLETRTEFWRQQRPIYARKKQLTRIPVKRVLQGHHSPSVTANEEANPEGSEHVKNLALPPKKKNVKSMANTVTTKPSTPPFKIPREKQAK